MKYKIRKPDKTLKGTIQLEGSKSITNRVLIIKALTGDFFKIHNHSRSDDSITLFNLINSGDKILNAGDGGTTFRFLLAYLSNKDGERILTGSERLLSRPIGPLVEALKGLGADIQYLGKQGYPPVLIKGKMLSGNRVEIDGGTSSQFISALLLIAPILPAGMLMKVKGELVSQPYIHLTLHIMKHFGISYDWVQNLITIPRQEYRAREIKIESDWTASSYYFSMATLADEVDITLGGLTRISQQGDATIAQIMDKFGIQTSYTETGLQLKKTGGPSRFFEYDFLNCPDLAQTFVALCAGLNISAKFKGVSTLSIKESDRMQVMNEEIRKVGCQMVESGKEWTLIPSQTPGMYQKPLFSSHGDHRVAMSLAPLAIPFGEITIDNPMVVNKSYPNFWNDLKVLGFEVEELPED